MAVSADYKSFIEDLFEAVLPVRIKAMFGGAGVYSGDVMFGLIADERLFLKADADTKAPFEAEGCGPFEYAPPGGRAIPMTYWELPERLYDDPDELKVWAMRALDVAMKSKTAKTARKRPTKTSVKRRT